MDKEKVKIDKIDVILSSLGVVGTILFVKLLEQAICADHALETAFYGIGSFLSLETTLTSVSVEGYLLWHKKQLLEEKKKRQEEKMTL